ncbi:MAG: AAA family ATPase, partial [Bacteroidota bacterium]
QKLFWLASFLIDTLKNGGILVIDEFEANLHPHLSEAIVDLFQYRQTNPGGGQLIVATHDTNLLQPSLLRRDQITFVEKDSRGASEVYDLSDIEGVRESSPYEKHYTSGKYGSVPQITHPLVRVQS